MDPHFALRVCRQGDLVKAQVGGLSAKEQSQNRKVQVGERFGFFFGPYASDRKQLRFRFQV